ncbi:ArgR family transcriptional regulator, partial [Staphylococcus aureus]
RGNDTTLILTPSNDMAEYVYAKLFN